MRHTVGLIRVVTLDSEEKLNLHGRLIESVFSELKVISKCIENQPRGIYDYESEEIAKPKILRLAREFAEEGVEAVIISCAADPAVEEARRFLKIPVIGAGSAVAAVSLAYGSKVGVLNLTDQTPSVIKKTLGSHMVAEDRPEGVRNTLDLMTDWGRRAAEEALKRLLKYEIDVIALACTGYSTIGFGRIARNITNTPVINPVIAAGAVTLNILKQKEVDGA